MSYFGDDSKNWVGIVVPLCIVGVIALATLVVLIRRRHIRLRRNGVSLNRQGRLALERDILQEEGYGDGRPRQLPLDQSVDQNQGIYLGRYFRSSNTHTADLVVNDHAPRRSSSGVAVSGGRRQPRTANRWAWANTVDLSATTRRQDRMEGLNELGEAPPPYEAPPKKHASTSVSIDGAVHLDDEQHGEADTDGVATPERAYLRRASGSGPAHERNRSIDGDTIAATLTAVTISTTATTAAATTSTTTTSAAASSATSSRSQPVSSASAEQATASTAVTSPRASPPAYIERTAGGQADSERR